MTLTIAHLDHMFVLTEEYQAYVATIAEKRGRFINFCCKGQCP